MNVKADTPAARPRDRWALMFVGGPWAGRVIDYGPKAPSETFYVQELESVSGTLIDGPRRDPAFPYQIKRHSYAFRRVAMTGPGCRLEVAAWVHESVTDESQVVCAVLAAAFAGALVSGLAGCDPSAGAKP